MNLTNQMMGLLLMATLVMHSVQAADGKIVVAHRGASGYLPEHTLASKVLAHAMGADYIEQDVVMTSDNELVVLHDLTLDRVTDVAEKFTDRAREDGFHYVIDFTLAELRTLHVTESPAANQRFPAGASRFGIHTLAEEIELIQGLNKTTGREVGIYPEIKSPWFHHLEGKDSATAILRVLRNYGYDSMDDSIFLQTFDFNELKRIHEELFPALEMEIPLVQLIAHNEWGETMEWDSKQWINYDYNWMREDGGMTDLAVYADGVGPAMDMIVSYDSSLEEIKISNLVGRANAAGLQVHPYTFRLDPGRMPAYITDFNALLELFLVGAGVDGVFTDFPDVAVRFVDALDD